MKSENIIYLPCSTATNTTYCTETCPDVKTWLLEQVSKAVVEPCLLQQNLQPIQFNINTGRVRYINIIITILSGSKLRFSSKISKSKAHHSLILYHECIIGVVPHELLELPLHVLLKHCQSFAAEIQLKRPVIFIPHCEPNPGLIFPHILDELLSKQDQLFRATNGSPSRKSSCSGNCGWKIRVKGI
ncbi:unnamed protein product [Cuscuta campestris]|uniref:Uncharacterized protein n=1 Tax=Cuscuta campestris TaxID=132261 RepID=A0A484NGL4_9ASTE|nr:unnamed protein product [Cuscuta campestris]